MSAPLEDAALEALDRLKAEQQRAREARQASEPEPFGGKPCPNTGVPRRFCTCANHAQWGAP